MKHLKNIMRQASNENIIKGKSWYNDAQEYSRILSVKYNVSMPLVASVIAALSPRNRWERNKIDAENVISHVFNGTTLQKVAVFNAMKNKALSLCKEMTHEERLKILNGIKIQSFYCNIIGDESRVTIDTWIDLAYSGEYKAVKERNALTLGRYRIIEKDIKKLAKQYNMKAYELQAIVWLQFQEQVKENNL